MALRGLMAQHGIAAADIARIDVACSTFTYRHTVWDYRADGVTEAQMNMAYALAVTALDGNAFVEQYSPARVVAPDVMAFAPKVHVTADPDIDAEGPALRDHIRLTLTSGAGAVHTAELRYRPGSPEDPMSPDELRGKFMRLCQLTAAAGEAAAIPDLVARLDDLGNTGELTSLLAGAAAQTKES